MSVHIPIYKRILYDDLDNNNDSVKQVQDPVRDLEIYNKSKQSAVENVRQTVSAPSHLFVDQHFENGVARTLNSAPSMTRLNIDNQPERWRERNKHLSQSRAFKRTSNIIAHRQDMGYYISGSQYPIKNRYDIDEEDLIRLRMLAHSRAERSSKSSTRNNSAMQRKLGGSPSGQNVSPVPPRSANSERDREKLRSAERRYNEKQRRRDEKQKRLEEKERFEKEMEERYKPKKPEEKSMIFITESHENGRERTFLTDEDFIANDEAGSVYTFINEKQREAFTSIFNNIDKNGDGHVDMNELKQKLSSVISKKDRQHFLQVFDLNKDHTVDVREFVTICALNDALCGIKTEDDSASLALDLEKLAKHITLYKELFNVVDEDNDGCLQPDEVLLLVMAALEGEQAQSSKKTEQGEVLPSQGTLNNIDINGVEKNTKRTMSPNTEKENTQSTGTNAINANANAVDANKTVECTENADKNANDCNENAGNGDKNAHSDNENSENVDEDAANANINTEAAIMSAGDGNAENISGDTVKENMNVKNENAENENADNENAENENADNENAENENAENENAENENAKNENAENENAEIMNASVKARNEKVFVTDDEVEDVAEDMARCKTMKEEKMKHIDIEEARRVLDSIEKDDYGYFDFVSFLSYTPFFARLLNIILESPLSISRLEDTRDTVTRKLSRKTER